MVFRLCPSGLPQEDCLVSTTLTVFRGMIHSNYYGEKTRNDHDHISHIHCCLQYLFVNALTIVDFIIYQDFLTLKIKPWLIITDY